MQCLEAAFRRIRPQRRPGSHRSGDTLEVLCSEVLKLEQIAEELSRTFGNDHAAWLCNAFQASCKVGRLANDCLLLISIRSEEVAVHHHSSSNADTRLEGCVRLQFADCRDQFQPRAHGLLCIVFVLRATEVDQHPVAHVLRYETVEALHGLGDTLLVGGNDLAEVFRVHPPRKCR